MNNKDSYKTKQKEYVKAYFNDHQKMHVTAQEVYDYLVSKGLKVGLTTVYRHLDDLVKKKILIKYDAGSSKGAYYEFVNDHGHMDHIHLKCKKCGTLYHHDSDALEKLREILDQDLKFDVDVFSTVVFGICKDCNKEE